MSHVAAAPLRSRSSHRVRGALGWLRDALLILGVVAAVGGAIAVIVLRLGFTPMLTSSMEPAYHAGDVLVSKPKPTQDLGVGDVPILPLPDSSGSRYAHRIVMVQSGSGIEVRTKGDNNPSVDPWRLTVTSQETPVVIASIPRVGWLSNYITSPAWRLVLGVGVLVLAVVGITGLLRRRR